MFGEFNKAGGGGTKNLTRQMFGRVQWLSRTIKSAPNTVFETFPYCMWIVDRVLIYHSIDLWGQKMIRKPCLRCDKCLKVNFCHRKKWMKTRLSIISEKADSMSIIININNINKQQPTWSWLLNNRWQSKPSRLLATAAARQWLEFNEPQVMIHVLFCRSASANKNSNFRICEKWIMVMYYNIKKKLFIMLCCEWTSALWQLYFPNYNEISNLHIFFIYIQSNKRKEENFEELMMENI